MKADPDALLFDAPLAEGERRRYPGGAQVPTWLLDLEPIHSASVPAPIMFSGPADVMDCGDRFLILPLYAGLSSYGVVMTEATGCTIMASTKEVRLVTACAIIHINPTSPVTPMSMELLTQLKPRPKLDEPRQQVGDVVSVRRAWWGQSRAGGFLMGAAAFLLGAGITAALADVVVRLLGAHPLF